MGRTKIFDRTAAERSKGISLTEKILMQEIIESQQKDIAELKKWAKTMTHIPASVDYLRKRIEARDSE